MFRRNKAEQEAKKERRYNQMKERDSIGLISKLVDKFREADENLRIANEIRKEEKRSRKW